MPIDNIHLNAFLATLPQFQNQGGFGHNPTNFLKGIINRIGINNTSQSLIQIQNTLPNHILSRNEVFVICNNNEFSIAYKVICVFAWGGMRQSTTGSDLFFGNWNNYQTELDQIIQNFRKNVHTRGWVYERLKRMNMKGCRPAYYTKLIFFFGNGNSYIMDQWTSKSIELLWTIDDRIGIIFDNGGNYVQANNHSGLYEEFCNRMEILTLIANHQTNSNFTPTEIEERIFSNGANRGQNRGPWRTYVEANW
jgi:hypothetical protein